MAVLQQVLAAAVSAGQNEIPQDFIARYVAADAVGTTLPDQSANELDASISGATKYDDILYFDGSNDYINLAALLDVLKEKGAGTIALQVGIPASGNAVLSIGVSGTNSYMQFAIARTALAYAFRINGQSSGVNYFQLTKLENYFGDGGPRNIVFTSDPSTGLKVYVEGFGEITGWSVSGTPNDKWFDDIVGLNSGMLNRNAYSSMNAYYKSFFASATFYDRVLKQSEINKLLKQPHATALVAKPVVYFGDSITDGYGVSSSQRYVNVLSAAKGLLNWEEQGVSADQAADLSANVQANFRSTPDAIYTVMVGTNDALNYKNDTTKQGYYRVCLRQALAWLALPTKTIARDMTASGSWSDTPVNAIGRYSTANGAKLTTTVKGTAVYVGYIISSDPAAEGVAEVRIDGNLVGTLNTYAPGINTYNGDTYAPAAAYFGGLSDGPHTVEVTVTSSGEYFYLDYVAGAPQTPPKILVSNIVKMTDSAYPSWSISQTTLETYNGIIEDVLDEFAENGMEFQLVDNFNTLDTSTDYMVDGIHPNAAGHAKLAAAFGAFI